MPVAEGLAVALMAGVTLLTRLGGPPLGAVLSAHPQLERGLRHLSLPLLAALAAPAVAEGDAARAFGVAAACALVIVTRSVPLSILIGAAAAAAIRFV